jgi:hypothetical protein
VHSGNDNAVSVSFTAVKRRRIIVKNALADDSIGLIPRVDKAQLGSAEDNLVSREGVVRH